jgi:hypothetical protein
MQIPSKQIWEKRMIARTKNTLNHATTKKIGFAMPQLSENFLNLTHKKALHYTFVAE